MKIYIYGTVILMVVFVFTAGIHANFIKFPVTKNIHNVYVADFNKDNILVGFSDNIFIGKVNKEIETVDFAKAPVTKYSVDIISNIKGDFKGEVFVYQQGGYKNGILFVVEGGDQIVSGKAESYLLHPGYTYVFATVKNHILKGNLLLSHPNAIELISKDDNASYELLKKNSENNETVIKFKKAYINEEISKFHVDNENSFLSLPVEKQQELRSEAEKFK
ncbi:MAG: hypothetical protein WCT49_04070 [Candidatus Paceibacterota bacterium]|jgi:hypothetical protein|nr:hypothetical protein [Candidatus Paceibacterota bacterium]